MHLKLAFLLLTASVSNVLTVPLPVQHGPIMKDGGGGSGVGGSSSVFGATGAVGGGGRTGGGGAAGGGASFGGASGGGISGGLIRYGGGSSSRGGGTGSSTGGSANGAGSSGAGRGASSGNGGSRANTGSSSAGTSQSAASSKLTPKERHYERNIKRLLDSSPFKLEIKERFIKKVHELLDEFPGRTFTRAQQRDTILQTINRVEREKGLIHPQQNNNPRWEGIQRRNPWQS